MMMKYTENFKQEAIRIALTSGLSRRRDACIDTRLPVLARTADKPRSRGDMKVLAHIREQYGFSLGSYGRPRVTMELG